MSSNIYSVGNNITRIARELKNTVWNRDLAPARQLVENLTREERVAVTRQKTDNCTLLGLAIDLNKVSFVRFLLEECHADVEQLSGLDQHTTTPLCIAASYRLDEIVPLLIDHGANVNATGCDQCTPVHVAVKTDLKLVRYLVEKGADIQLPDIYGETCLMRSIRFFYPPRITVNQYLIEQGASMNAVDNLGDSALHYAVRRTSICQHTTASECIVGQLLRHGADTSIRNQSGDDALQTAALHASPEIINYLIDELKPTSTRCADLYSLVAARCVDEFHNFSGAVHLWKESLSIRMQASQEEPMAGPNSVYNSAVEARDVESLEAIADDRDALYMQALIRRERILGSSHYETIHWLTKRAFQLARKSNSFQRGIDMYRYASASCGPAVFHPVREIGVHRDFVRLLQDNAGNGSVRFDDAAAVLKVMVEMSKCESTLSFGSSGTKRGMLQTGFGAIELMCRLKSSEVESRSLKQLVRKLIQSRCYALNHALVLRPAVDRVCSSEPYGSAIVKELLEAGADVNAVDSAGNTALHLATRSLLFSGWANRSLLRVIDLLLHHGAHVDIRNFRGETAADRLPSTVDKMQYVTLQCLAARAIRRHRVTYHNILPTSMTQFVDLHTH